jgi:predicted PurR-regulated permease PerM
MENNWHHPANPDSRSARRMRDFTKRVGIVFGAAALFLFLFALLWFASDALLLIFSGILIAVLLHDASCQVERWIPLPRGAALSVVLLTVIAIFALAGWLLASQVIDQVSQLVDALPEALEKLRAMLLQNHLVQEAMHSMSQLSLSRLLGGQSLVIAEARSMFSGALGMLTSFAIVLFLGIYLAIHPQIYTQGVLKLLPQQKRERGAAVLNELGQTLKLWLRGKLLSMALIGAATAIGLTLLGVPLALALGLLAGLLDFIPYLGPIMAAVPALLIAFSQGPVLALYVVLLFAILQSLEGYLLLPMVERKTVALPPALTIAMQVFMGLAFGLLGVALATPLTAVATVLIAMLYVQDLLEDHVTLPAKQK